MGWSNGALEPHTFRNGALELEAPRDKPVNCRVFQSDVNCHTFSVKLEISVFFPRKTRLHVVSRDLT